MEYFCTESYPSMHIYSLSLLLIGQNLVPDIFCLNDGRQVWFSGFIASLVIASVTFNSELINNYFLDQISGVILVMTSICTMYFTRTLLTSSLPSLGPFRAKISRKFIYAILGRGQTL